MMRAQKVPLCKATRNNVLAVGAGLLLVGAGGWLTWKAAGTPTPADPPASRANGRVQTSGSLHPLPETDRPQKDLARAPEPALFTAREAYQAGRYEDAEQAARVALTQSASPNPAACRRRTEARRILAFSQARQQEYGEARAQFALLRREAAALPDRGRQEAGPSESTPTLEEEGTYQHAVLTAALGERKAAEAEYLALMRRYPESPLVHAAVRRIAGFYGGNIPPEAQRVWQEAMKTVQARERERDRQAALCAPECLAELLRRRDGQAAPLFRPPIEALAREMGTSDQGTSLKALAETARKQGFPARGLRLTWKGLEQQKLPVIALIKPGHFVLVETVRPGSLQVWNPDGNGPGLPSTKHYLKEYWAEVWDGVVLALQ